MGHRSKAVFKGAGGRKYLTGLILDIDFWSPIWETSSNNYREEVLPPGTKRKGMKRIQAPTEEAGQAAKSQIHSLTYGHVIGAFDI